MLPYPTPLVSIWITAYNHEKFIAEAIEGVLMQQTNFAFEIVIGEDCSADRTREIVLTYKNKYPNKIRLFLPNHNLGMIPMFKASYNLCTGYYVAWLDGDDYWTDPLKLQKQVDFMEANADFVLCFHNIRYVDHIRGIEYGYAGPNHKNPDNTLSVKHILHTHNQIFTLSVLYRNVLGAYLPDWFYTLPFPDLGFYFLLSKHGKIKYIDEVMGVYRVHKEGSFSGLTNQLKFNKSITFFKLLKENLDYLSKDKINRIIGYYYYRLVKNDIKKFSFREAYLNLKYLITYDSAVLKQNKTDLAKLILKIPVSILKNLIR
jgi:glycosyltransferase involved in cell wall biosynthesis